MGKLFAGAALGVFAGALVVELLHRRDPEATYRLERRARAAAGGLAEWLKGQTYRGPPAQRYDSP